MGERVIIEASVLAADLSDLASAARLAEEAGADRIHLDMMDGHFVPNLTFGPPVARALARRTRLPMHAHLMVESPDPLLEELVSAGVELVSVHVETTVHIHRTLEKIRSLGMKPAVAINPGTSLSSLEEVIPWCSAILLMSVDPGFAGQKFIASCLNKIERLAEMIRGRDIELAVDGGLDDRLAAEVAKRGATTLVFGSYIFSGDTQGAIRAVRARISSGDRR